MTTTPGPARRPGVLLGVDVGSVRVGVARSDPDGLLATPLETVPRASAETPAAGDDDLRRIAALVADHDAVGVVVGLPRSLSGAEGVSAHRARTYADVLAVSIDPVPVRLVDERLTTVEAHRALRESGVAGRRQRSVVDQAAAVLILQSALDAERATGQPAGELVGARRRKPRTKGTRT
ncbi:Holliday junction resolvase RuvX [Nostocoides sp. Soil756]|uniref:Holliday junction resolvase RuvX n=1 Tax=Nostocoides sp. Soil756 TaxID=1736399 RepID=UPI0006F36234|nr:Holliday junction resolvase RuvX [Tetrasphaera sp. Soil756]KRE63155.1 Holliday junction resolvase [Tetrasphaera sp. Soil756]